MVRLVSIDLREVHPRSPLQVLDAVTSLAETADRFRSRDEKARLPPKPRVTNRFPPKNNFNYQNNSWKGISKWIYFYMKLHQI